jgi:uncharacterized protein YggE
MKSFAAFVMVFTCVLSVSAQTIKVDKDNRTLSVTASDHAEADPEVADLHIGFTAYGADLPSAYRSGSQLSNAITAAIVAAGTPRSAIQSQVQRVTRLDDAAMKTRKGMRFSVTQSWIVSVDPKDAALVLDAAVQKGANESGQIEWRMKNSITLNAEAIGKATERARAMAVSLAKGMGVTLGKPLYATNEDLSSAFTHTPGAGLTMYEQRDRSIISAGPMSIEAQRVERQATVTLVFAME